MAKFNINQGDAWSVFVPVYRWRSNHELYLIYGGTGDITEYWQAYENFRLTRPGNTSEADFLDSTRGQNNQRNPKVLMDLTGWDLSYQIRSGFELKEQVLVTTQIFTDDQEKDTAALGYINLQLSKEQTGNLSAGNYTGQLQLDQGGQRKSTPADSITVIKDVNYE